MYIYYIYLSIYLFLFDRRNSKKVVCRELTTLRATINLEGKPIPISTWNINTTKMKCVPFSPLYPWQPFVTTAICYFQKRKRSKGTRVGCHKSITCETTTTTLLIVAPSRHCCGADAKYSDGRGCAEICLKCCVGIYDLI